MIDTPRPLMLVTGAGGFVGAAIVRGARAAGYRVAALVRQPHAWRLAGLRGIIVHAADLSDRDAIYAALADIKPSIVVHSAWEGVGGPKRAADIQLQNIATTCTLVDASIAAGAGRFIGIGSQAEYGRFDRRLNETDLPSPTMLYGAAKLSACHLTRQRCEEAGVKFSWLRLFSVYGPGDNPNWLIPSCVAEMLAGRAPRTTEGRQLWDYLHVDDVARGILAVAGTTGASGIFNLSSGEPVAVRSILEMLRDIAAPGLTLRFGEIAYGPGQIMHLEGDNSRLKDVTGWAPRISLAAGLASTVEAMRMAA